MKPSPYGLNPEWLETVRRLGATLRKLRRTRKARPVWRKKAMAKLDSWASEHELPPEPFVRMKQAVITLFAQMELRGELD